MTKAPPVAHPGIEAKMGEKNTDTKNAIPVTIAVMPVIPPSAKTWIRIHKLTDLDIPLIPVALSMNAVTGLVPSTAPMAIENASTQYAIVEFSKSIVTGSRSPANLAIEYRVLS
jgi:hypothetical protein